ncbi:hypothetical protein [Komagataeibacter sp. FNDCR2]|uniref:hypothetical protein n=1 Tax=Komagataeibacter sp. FNDCR2 TaxID=2878682 RepID=UPI001E2C0FD1|nr:hypothetical protein [Komagataeibacter sp. FNDCR2]MCE2574470.1 hypothetical protein [Komagataeibacter sp. FNDCR2]
MEYPFFQHRYRRCERMREMVAAGLLIGRCPVFVRRCEAMRRLTPLEGQNGWRGENQCRTLRG